MFVANGLFSCSEIKEILSFSCSDSTDCLDTYVTGGVVGFCLSVISGVTKLSLPKFGGDECTVSLLILELLIEFDELAPFEDWGDP